ncbi:MAG: hypothetical protein HQ518_10840 [Rhodopirellula sp.]|nr:hypothetical protein [Rhodopirellula sp.]
MPYDRGLLRSWADVNSLGGPAAFVDQLRTDSSRRAAPATGLAEVAVTELPRSAYSNASQEFDLIPMCEPFKETADFTGTLNESYGGASRQPAGSGLPPDDSDRPSGDLKQMSHTILRSNGNSTTGIRRPVSVPVKPTGAWLF